MYSVQLVGLNLKTVVFSDQESHTQIWQPPVIVIILFTQTAARQSPWYNRKLQALVYDILPLEKGAGKRCSECVSDCGGRCRKAMLGVCGWLWRKVPESDARSVWVTVEEGAGKRCSECVSDCGGRCRKAMLGMWHNRWLGAKHEVTYLLLKPVVVNI